MVYKVWDWRVVRTIRNRTNIKVPVVGTTRVSGGFNNPGVVTL